MFLVLIITVIADFYHYHSEGNKNYVRWLQNVMYMILGWIAGPFLFVFGVLVIETGEYFYSAFIIFLALFLFPPTSKYIIRFIDKLLEILSLKNLK